MKKVNDHLYSARWAITEAIENGDYAKLDYATDKIVQAKADIIEPIEPDRPDETPDISISYQIPKIVVVPGVRFKTHGHYKTSSGKAKGLVVHYTVSGSFASSAKAVLAYLAKKGLGCMVMDNQGVIYIPENFDLMKDVAYHAGSSSWKGKSGISAYCMGMEICNWGKLDNETKNYAKEIRSHNGKDNIIKGDYEPYTDVQEASLVNFIMWLADNNPEFSLDWLVGHDEICNPKGRKTDPGASLSMTMPEFRKHISGLI